MTKLDSFHTKIRDLRSFAKRAAVFFEGTYAVLGGVERALEKYATGHDEMTKS